MSPLERIQALTLCLDQALKDNRLSEIPCLLEARGQAVNELLESGLEQSDDRVQKLRELETELMNNLRSRRNAALERLSSLKAGKQARRAYSIADF